MRLSPFWTCFLASVGAVEEKGATCRRDDVEVVALVSRDESCLSDVAVVYGIRNVWARDRRIGEQYMVD